jgi:hypothetical protein
MSEIGRLHRLIYFVRLWGENEISGTTNRGGVQELRERNGWKCCEKPH